MPGLLFGALEAISVASAAHLWIRARGSVTRKLLWTPVVLVPVIGPLFYGAIYDPPSEQDEDLRAAESNTDSEDDD
jgi:hypothetical protein